MYLVCTKNAYKSLRKTYRKISKKLIPLCKRICKNVSLLRQLYQNTIFVWFKNQTLFFTVLKAGKCKIKAPTNAVSAESSLSHFQTATFSLSSLGRETEDRERERSTIIEALLSWPHRSRLLPIGPTSKYYCIGVWGFNRWILREHKHLVHNTEDWQHVKKCSPLLVIRKCKLKLPCDTTQDWQ